MGILRNSRIRALGWGKGVMGLQGVREGQASLLQQGQM